MCLTKAVGIVTRYGGFLHGSLCYTPSVCYCGLFVARQVAPPKVTLQRCDLLRSMWFCNSHASLSVMLVEFADTDTAQEMHHRADINS